MSSAARQSRLRALLVALAVMLVTGDLRADGAPISLQVQLVARLAAFDRNFAARAGKTANILVVRKASDAGSVAETASLTKLLSETKDIGGLPPKIDQADFSDAAKVVEKAKNGKYAIVYFTTGLEGEMGKIADGFAGADMLTIGTTAKHAENGAVVGIGLEEARPKLVLNLKRAKAQNVSFKAELLKLARVIE